MRGEHGECDVGQRNGLLGALHLEPAAGEFEIVFRTFHQVRRDRPRLRHDFLGSLDHGDTTDSERA